MTWLISYYDIKIIRASFCYLHYRFKVSGIYQVCMRKARQDARTVFCFGFIILLRLTLYAEPLHLRRSTALSPLSFLLWNYPGCVDGKIKKAIKYLEE